MGKWAIIAGFLISFALALWLFFSRETMSLRENMEKAPSHKKPRVILQEFIVRRWRGSLQIHELKADYGDFRAPNVVELKGGVRAWFLRENGDRQHLSSGRAIAWFEARSLSELLAGDKEMDHAFLRDHVRVTFKDHVLMTDEVQYVTRQKLLTGQRPVRISGPGRWFTGRNGFRYDLEDETFNVYGKVRGMVIPDDSSSEK